MAEIIKDLNYFPEENEINVSANAITPTYDLIDGDILRLEIYNGEILVDTVDLDANTNITTTNNVISINYFNILNEQLGYTSGTFNIKTRILRNPIYPNEEVRVDQISRNKTEMRLDGWIDDNALIGIRRPLAHPTPEHLKQYAITTWELEDYEADECYKYANDRILSKPTGTWYANVEIKAEQEGRSTELQALHSANWQINAKDNAPGYNVEPVDKGYKPLLLEHEKAGYKRIISWTVDTFFKEASLIIKSAGKFTREIKEGDVVRLWDDIIDPVQISVNIDLEEQSYPEESSKLKGPDWTINVNKEVGKTTDLNSWDDILAADAKTNSQIVDSIFSGSEVSELNIDYSNSSNFIHFSSAEERLKNFKYKLELIESYTLSKASTTSSATGSTYFTTESSALEAKINNLIGTFDGYEKKIYYSSASTEYTDTYGTHWNYTWPKSNAVKPYTQFHSTSSEAIAWFSDALIRAQDYDNGNLNALRNLIPMHVKLDPQNNGYVLFVDMIAQHFDTMYNYIDHIPMMHDKNENSRVGLSKDLLFDVLSSFGWKPESGLDLADLWTYHLGVNKDGTTDFNTGSAMSQGATTVITSSTGAMISYKDLETEPWSRILNNLPFLLKTKGTRRGLQALIACYGIPQSILKVQEFGGPDPSNPVSGSNNKEITQPAYSTKFDGSSTWIFQGPFSDFGNNTKTVELRFRTTHSAEDMNLVKGYAYTAPSTVTETWALAVVPSTGKKAKIRFQILDAGIKTAITSELPLLDDDWWSVFLTYDSATTQFTVRVQKVPDHTSGIVTHTTSTTLNAPNQLGWEAGGQAQYLHIGDSQAWAGFNPTAYFKGYMQEFRLWKSELATYVQDIHTKAPISILGNSYTGSYDNLYFRLPLGADTQKPDYISNVGVINSGHPNQTITHTATFKNSGSFKSGFMEEDYFTPVPNSIGIRSVDNKVRIESNDNVGPLHPFETREKSSGDFNPEDSNLLFAGFSPQDELDTDIALQFGGMSIDDIVGDPRDNYKSEYKELEQFRNAYFKKYAGANNIWAFMRIIKYFNSALFKQIESMLPARANKIVGLMIKQSLLERPKMVTHPEPSFLDLHHRGYVDIYNRKDVAVHPYLATSGSSYTGSAAFPATASHVVYEVPKTMISSDEHDSSVMSRDELTDPTNYIWSSIVMDGGVAWGQDKQYKGMAEPLWNGWFDLRYTSRDRDRDFTVVSNDAGLYGGQNVFTGSFEMSETMVYASSSRMTDCRKFETFWSNSSATGYNQVGIQIMSPSTAIENLLWNGCKMQSDDWNVPSADTYDGGAVVEIWETNPNALIADDNNTMHDGEITVR